MADLITIPSNGRWYITDGGALALAVPYTNGDIAEGEEREGDGWKTEVVMCRGVPIGAVQTERAPLDLTFTAVRVDTDSAVTIEHILHKKGAWASPTSTFSGPSARTHYTCAWQEYDGSTWNTKRSYKYCLLAGKNAEKTPANEISVKITAIPYADDWRTVTVP